MASITVMINTQHTAKDGLYPIVVRVDHKGKRRLLSVGHRVQKKFWTGATVSGKHPQALLINAAISSKEEEIRRYLAECQLRSKPVRLDLIGSGHASYSFTAYLKRRADQYKASGKIVMSRKVNQFVKELDKAAGREVYFDDVTLDFLRQLEQTQIDAGNVENTRHKKFKFLSEFYGHAIKEGQAEAPNPFHAYKIQPKPVKKDKLTLAEIKSIEDLPLLRGPLSAARDLFLFSYYTKGQRFEVCITTRRDQLRNGRIYFRTNKGNDYISVKIHDRLQMILDRYKGKRELLFPFLDEVPEDPEQYLSVIGSQNAVFNRNLKAVAGLADITIPLTFHLARHSFAYHLKKTSASLSVVQDALGHSDQKTTAIYVKALEDDFLDGEMDKLYGA